MSKKRECLPPPPPTSLPSDAIISHIVEKIFGLYGVDKAKLAMLAIVKEIVSICNLHKCQNAFQLLDQLPATLKETLSQLKVDKDAQIRLLNYVVNLRENNFILFQNNGSEEKHKGSEELLQKLPKTV